MTTTQTTQLYDPAKGQWVQVDSGAVSQSILLLNILIELRLHTLFISLENRGRCKDEINDLREDIANDPQSLFVPPAGAMILGESITGG